MPTLKLQSADGILFHVDLDTARCCGVIRTMFDNDGVTKNYEETIPLPRVKGEILKKVLEWCSYHKYDNVTHEDYENDSKSIADQEIPAWDVEFLKVDAETLLELLMAANYLEVKGLFREACKITAGMIKGRSPEEIRQLFNIENDLGDVEEL